MLSSRLHVLISGDASGALDALNKTGEAVKGAGSKMGAAARVAGGAVAAAGTAAAGLGAVVAGIGVSQAASAESAEIAFTTMLGSGEKAQDFLGELKAFAAETPFEFPELQTAASSLVSAGIETSKVIPLMTTLGNVTSGMGTGAEGVQRATIALQQMTAEGKISGENLAQLRDAGIPVFDLLSAATGKSVEQVAELANAGKLGKQELDQLMGALESGAGLERFGGLMEKQSASLSGQISTLKDTLSQGLGDAAAPLAETLKGVMPDLVAALGPVMTAMGPVFESIGRMVEALVPLFEPVSALIASLSTVFTNVLGSILEAIAPVLTMLVPVIQQLGEAFGDGLAEVLPEVGTALLAIAEAVAPLLPQLMDLALSALLPLVRILAELVTAAAPFIGTLISALMPALNAVLEALRPLLPVLQDALMEAVVALQPVLLQVADAFVQLITALLPMLPGLVELLGAVVVLAPALLSLALQVLVPLMEVLTPLIGLVAELVGWLAGGLAGAVDDLSGSMGGAFAGMIDGVSDKLSDLILWFVELPDRLVLALVGVATQMHQAGTDWIDGLVQGLQDAASAPLDFIRNLAGDMLGSFTGLFDINSPSRVMATQGAHLIEGLTRGLDPRPVQAAWDAVLGGISAPAVGAAAVGMGAAAVGAAAGGVHIGTLVVNGGGSPDEARAAVVEALSQVAQGGSRTLRQTKGRS